MLQGSLVALITPMNQDGSIHYEQLRDLIDWHINNGTDGIVNQVAELMCQSIRSRS